MGMLQLTRVPDDELIVRVRDGDDDAFSTLYERHRGDVEAYARRLCPNASLVDDVVAESFFKTLRAIRNGHGPLDGFRLYVFTAVRRTAGRMVHVAHEELPGLDVDAMVEDADGELFEVDGDRTSGPAIAALRLLPERARRALWLLEVEGWSTAELAEALGLSTNAASALAYRSRQRLRETYLALIAT